jgi:hypothetical protein
MFLINLQTITSGNSGLVEPNKWMGISLFLFLMWALTLFFLNRRIKQVNELEERLKCLSG